MTAQATHDETIVSAPVLYMAIELSKKAWRVLFAHGGARRERSVSASGGIAALMAEIAAAKRRFGLPEACRVVSCYEAGRDGFWIDRALRARGVENLVVDSSSIEVSRRQRRRKSDRIDLVKLMSLLQRHGAGERGHWSVVRVPDPEAEDVRQLSRAIERLKAERDRHRARLKSLLATQGILDVAIGAKDWSARLGALNTPEGASLGRWLAADLSLEGERLALVEAQLKRLKAEREALVAKADGPAAEAARALKALGGIATESSFVFATECFGWRRFANRRQLAGAAGLTGTPYASGESVREQGISKAGNRRLRTMLVEIAWCWLRHQPQSALARWWQARFGTSGKRARRIGIVALARKLLVALWRYLEQGIVPQGALLKRRAPAVRAAGGMS